MEKLSVESVLSPHFMNFLEHDIGREEHKYPSLRHLCEYPSQGFSKHNKKVGVVAFLEGELNLVFFYVIDQDSYKYLVIILIDDVIIFKFNWKSGIEFTCIGVKRC